MEVIHVDVDASLGRKQGSDLYYIRNPQTDQSEDERLSEITHRFLTCQSKAAFLYYLLSCLPAQPMIAKSLGRIWDIIQHDTPELRQQFADMVIGTANGVAGSPPNDQADLIRSLGIMDSVLVIANGMGEPYRTEVTDLIACSPTPAIAELAKRGS